MLDRTALGPRPYPFQIVHPHQLLTLGSCFADELGLWLYDRKFKVDVNPTGSIYHPLALVYLLNHALKGSYDPRSFTFEHQGLFQDVNFHSKFSHPDPLQHHKLKEEVLSGLQSALMQADILMITLGTSWAYELGETPHVVANCHKLPAKQFRKTLSSISDMKSGFSSFLRQWHLTRPEAHVILTVSPVRHVKDGMEDNQLSKSMLRVLCDELSRESDFVHYYPAYELMVDDLRDYRYYADDLIHPSQRAVAYIASHFSSCFFSSSTQELIEEWMGIKMRLDHRPRFPGTESYLQFLQQLRTDLKSISSKLPVEEERIALEKLAP